MKSLQTIQKTYHVFEILLRIGMIAAFIWAAISAAGVICVVAFQDSVAELIHGFTGISDASEIIGSLLCSLIAALADGILCLLALRYVKAEQSDGTPFTFSGAIRLKRLGIQTIVIPLVAQILSAVVYEIFDVTFQPEWFDGGNIIIGVVLILVALVFRYGAELSFSEE